MEFILARRGRAKKNGLATELCTDLHETLIVSQVASLGKHNQGNCPVASDRCSTKMRGRVETSYTTFPVCFDNGTPSQKIGEFGTIHDNPPSTRYEFTHGLVYLRDWSKEV